MSQAQSEGDIRRIREEIDRIDRDLLELLNRRTQCALEIGKIKEKNNQPVYAPDREKKILDSLSKLNQGPMTQQAMETVFLTIFQQMRAMEERLKQTAKK